jgi:hypothetical protein
MNREEFSTLVSMTLEEVAQFAEEKAGQKLPRKFALQWSGSSEPRITENIVERIVERVFIDEKHIYPDVSLGICDLLDDGSLLIVGSVANYPPPRPFDRIREGVEGPFTPIVGRAFLNKLVGVKDSFSLDRPWSFISRDLAKPGPLHARPDLQKLPGKLRDDLSAITPSTSGDLTYWPCAARMKDGAVLVCVYVVPEGPYIRQWGVYPQQDRGKRQISIADVEALTDSPTRLPARFANKLYEAGESGMGYTIFTVVFGDGSSQAYDAGNAIDFVRYPEGKGQSDVVDVLPHEGRNAERVHCPEYYWCLFAE